MYFVYILKSVNKEIYYKGQTEDINRRIKEHFNSQVKSTRKLLPLKLVHVEVCETRKAAKSLELFFKSGYGREIIREIESNNIVGVAKLADAQA